MLVGNVTHERAWFANLSLGCGAARIVAHRWLAAEGFVERAPDENLLAALLTVLDKWHLEWQSSRVGGKRSLVVSCLLRSAHLVTVTTQKDRNRAGADAT